MDATSASLDALLGRAADEFMQELNAGGRPDVEEYARHYPQIASIIRGAFPALLVMQRSGPGLLSTEPARAAAGSSGDAGPGILPGSAGVDREPEAMAGRFGDFRLLREIGRGGMGVVYEAEQISLGRRVALKTLPLAGMLDPRQLRRFQNEARAAAQLHHPSILPIYSVGCERGVHYYAMQLIDGPTLAEVIRFLRSQEEPAGSFLRKEDTREGGPGTEGPDILALSLGRPLSPGSPGGVEELQSLPGSEVSHPPLDGEPGNSAGASSRISLDVNATSHFSKGALRRVESSSFTDVGTGESEIHRDGENAAGFAGQGIASTMTPTSVPLSPVLSDSFGDSTRSPAFFRAVAELGIQTADALQHAHDEGIVHRDIKPSNLLLDGRGKLWIADFGLARVEHDPGITMTGDVLGTLRYMSPEQALGKPTAVDHRTDVYSLGITLYELLTLMPAVPGHSRQQVLRRIAEEDFPPPSRLNAAIPRDLETIILKAASRERTDRYASAQGLANDLRCYLENRPIRARRPNLLERGRKWSRRHKAVLAAVAITGMALLVMAGVLLWRERAQTFAALAQAQHNLRDSERHRQSAESERARADANLVKACEAVDRMLTQTAFQLPDVKALNGIRMTLLERAVEFYQGFLQQPGNDDLRSFGFAGYANQRVAELMKELERFDRSEEACRAAISQLERVLAIDPENNCRIDLGKCHLLLARILCDMNQTLRSERKLLQEAEGQYVRGIEVFTGMLASDPHNPIIRLHVAAGHQDLGFLLDMAGRHGEAESHLRSAASAYEALLNAAPRDSRFDAAPALAGVHQQLGIMLTNMGRQHEAVASLRRAISLYGAQVSIHLPSAQKHALCRSQQLLGESLAALGRSEEAEVSFLDAIQGFEALCALDVEETDHPASLSWCHHELALARQAAGRAAQAEESFRRAIEIREKLSAKYPDSAVFPRHLARAWDHLGALLHEVGRTEEAAMAFGRARAAYESRVKGSDTTFLNGLWYAEMLVHCPEPRLRDPQRAIVFAETLLRNAPGSLPAMRVLGAAELRAGRLDRAIEALNQAVEARTAGGCISEFFLAMAHARRGDTQQARQLFEHGAAWMDANQPGSVELRRYRRQAAELLGTEAGSSTKPSAERERE